MDQQPPACLTAEETARELQLSPDYFRRRVGTLIKEHGFPRQLPGLGLRWSRAQVLSWCAGHAESDRLPMPPHFPGAANVTLIEEARGRLADRYAGGGR
ncbi:MAG TPA: hypothetical protein VGU72_04450 [Beijerinckiaceae bacterium]|jgi:hypothetical protein|nr:hypothetical protein [Beijerinckiaceae bacterium]